MTRFKNKSYPRRIPLTLRPPWRWTNNFLSMNYFRQLSVVSHEQVCRNDSVAYLFEFGLRGL